MNFVLENPKAVVTATAGVIIFVVKTFLLKDAFTPEIESWLNVILPSVFLALLGRYTRITKSQAEVLKEDKEFDDTLTGRNQARTHPKFPSDIDKF